MRRRGGSRERNHVRVGVALDRLRRLAGGAAVDASGSHGDASDGHRRVRMVAFALGCLGDRQDSRGRRERRGVTGHRRASERRSCDDRRAGHSVGDGQASDGELRGAAGHRGCGGGGCVAGYRRERGDRGVGAAESGAFALEEFQGDVFGCLAFAYAVEPGVLHGRAGGGAVRGHLLQQLRDKITNRPSLET